MTGTWQGDMVLEVSLSSSDVSMLLSAFRFLKPLVPFSSFPKPRATTHTVSVCLLEDIDALKLEKVLRSCRREWC